MSAPTLAVERLVLGDAPVNPRYTPGPLTTPGAKPKKVAGGQVLPASVPLTGSTPHGAVFGGSGSGKSVLLRVLLADLLHQACDLSLLDRLQIYHFDGKQTGAGAFLEFLPAVQCTETDPQAIARALLDLEAEARARFRAISTVRQRLAAGRPATWSAPPQCVVVIDELIFWLGLLPPKPSKAADAAVTAWRVRGEPIDAEVELDATTMLDSLKRGMMASRDAAMNYIVAMQAPQAAQGVANLSVPLRENLGWRAGMKLARDGDRELGLGDAAVGRGVDIDAPGIGVLAIPGTPYWTPFRVPWLADPADPRTPEAVRAATWKLLPPRDPAKLAALTAGAFGLTPAGV